MFLNNLLFKHKNKKYKRQLKKQIERKALCKHQKSIGTFVFNALKKQLGIKTSLTYEDACLLQEFVYHSYLGSPKKEARAKHLINKQMSCGEFVLVYLPIMNKSFEEIEEEIHSRA